MPILSTSFVSRRSNANSRSPATRLARFASAIPICSNAFGMAISSWDSETYLRTAYAVLDHSIVYEAANAKAPDLLTTLERLLAEFPEQ